MPRIPLIETSYQNNKLIIGLAGWINQFRLALIEHDLELYLSHYDE
ncbi:MAG: hypothetical protein J2P21_30565 [Chloracidobacterium sp.]|nr:hypothetical protein [Chloracidobacterium sp.]